MGQSPFRRPYSSSHRLVRWCLTISGANATIGGNIIIQSGGKLTFETTTGRTLTVNENAGSAKIQIGSSDGSTAGTLECRGATSGNNIIKLNNTTGTATSATVGIEVEAKGFLDIQGTSASSQNCQITNGGVTLDGTKNGYINAKQDSQMLIRYADIGYMGANQVTKYGVRVASVNSAVSEEGAIIEGSKTHDGYRGIIITDSVGVLVRNNEVYSHSSHGIQLEAIVSTSSNGNLIVGNIIRNNGGAGTGTDHDNVDTNTWVGNIVHSNTSYGFGMNAGDNNLIYNNTINNNGDDGIFLVNSANNNVMKNNIITNHTGVGSEGIDDNSTGNTIDYTLFFGNTTNGSTGTNTITTENPNYVSTDSANADFLYLDSDESTSAGPLGAGIELWGASPTVQGYINVGGRLDYVKNTTDDEEFNWLQDAHDDATSDILSAGDTVTTYTRDYVSDTIAGNTTELSSLGSTYYGYTV